MEDTAIILNHYAYSLRVDAQMLEYTEKSLLQSLLDEFQKFYDRFDAINHYYIYIEQSTVVKKTHIQGIVWTKNKLTANELTKARQWWKRPSGHISFTSAKKVKSLAAYCSKDAGERATNLSEDQLKKIPMWLNEKQLWATKLKLFLVQKVAETNGVKDYAHAVIKYYIDMKKSPPNRATIYKHLLRHHPDFDATDYCLQINLFKEQNY
ncbi:replication protein [uncultured marine virus]|nr:replication protein [uncultured marine virus]